MKDEKTNTDTAVWEKEKNKDANLTIGKYLTNFSKNHRLDSTIKHFFEKSEKKNIFRSKKEWDALIYEFMNSEVK